MGVGTADLMGIHVCIEGSLEKSNLKKISFSSLFYFCDNVVLYPTNLNEMRSLIIMGFLNVSVKLQDCN